MTDTTCVHCGVTIRQYPGTHQWLDSDGWEKCLNSENRFHMPDENHIIKVELTLLPTGFISVAVTKHFAPEYGGGEQVFTMDGGTSFHRALDVARGMVTLSPAHRTD